MAEERVLVVEDDRDISSLVERYLKREGYVVTLAPDGPSALERLDRSSFSLVLLDLRLPRVDGLEVLKRIRQDSGVPVIILSSRKEEQDKVKGLDLGADDYMTKPFSMPELTARVRAQLRRVAARRAPDGAEGGGVLGALDIELDVARACVRKGGAAVELTSTELQILRLLMSERGRIFTKSQIVEATRGEESTAEESAITVHVSNLRRKLGDDPARPRYIQTVWGIGYRFPEEPPA